MADEVWSFDAAASSDKLYATAMLKTLFHFAAYGFALLALCGLGYLMLSLWSEWRFLRRRGAARRQPAGGWTPPISILKPLRGTDRQMYESFRSHCLQDYPQYEIVFGVNHAGDEAVAEVERLRSEFPAHDIRLVICPETHGANRKVINLAQMMKEAKYDYIVVNDSDIRVERDYLRRIVAPMKDRRVAGGGYAATDAAPVADAKVGLVTALYRAEAGRSTGRNTGRSAGHSAGHNMEAVTIATDFAGGVLCAMELEGGLHFGLGSTLAFPRAAAEVIGGLEALA